jgi:probable F420-dependent oxidoreductase
MATTMEAAGLDSIWVYDHLLYRWPDRPTDGVWECWTMLSALAEATTRVELGTLVLCTAFRNPALLAKMAATLDEISAGRLILGLGAGWHEPEFEAFGIPFDHRATRFDEAVRIIKPLLRTGQVDLQGTYYSAPKCEITPRGPRTDGPPLLLAGNRPRMLDIVVRHADAWNTAWHAQPESALSRLASIKQACERNGRDPATLALTVGVSIAYPDLGGQAFTTSFLTENVAEALHGYAELGIKHVIVELAPPNAAAVERFARAVEQFRA